MFSVCLAIAIANALDSRDVFALDRERDAFCAIPSGTGERVCVCVGWLPGISVAIDDNVHFLRSSFERSNGSNGSRERTRVLSY